ncbi:hypothetical protein [Helicobacter sp.]|uniref:hypothetical protein n=1 Tax=Helicobacter sp. TaxID=218 RepID=UPI0025C4DFDC|nr:hypothetical protein [Helicobacter sp.]MBR2495589.1 hypothetical protein [Helicobacter sp.]
MFRFAISVGNFVAKLWYVLSLIAVVTAGIVTMFSGGFGVLGGLGIIVAGFLLVTLAFYLLFVFIDIRQQLVDLNAKLDKTENKRNF